jgi:hypothetical protein
MAVFFENGLSLLKNSLAELIEEEKHDMLLSTSSNHVRRSHLLMLHAMEQAHG